MLVGKIKEIELKNFVVDDSLFRFILNDYARKRWSSKDEFSRTEFSRPQMLTSVLYSAKKLYLKGTVTRGFANKLFFNCVLNREGIRKFIPFVKRDIDTYRPISKPTRGPTRGIINIKFADPEHKSKEEFKHFFLAKEFGIGDPSKLKSGLELTLVKPKVKGISRWPRRIVLEFNLTDSSNIFKFTAELSERNFKKLFGRDIFFGNPKDIIKKINGRKIKVVMDYVVSWHF